MTTKPKRATRAGDRTESGRVVKCWRARWKDSTGAEWSCDFDRLTDAREFFNYAPEEGETLRRVVKADYRARAIAAEAELARLRTPAPTGLRCWVAVREDGANPVAGTNQRNVEMCVDAWGEANPGHRFRVIAMAPASEVDEARRLLTMMLRLGQNVPVDKRDEVRAWLAKGEGR